ncbi:MAG: hypothetical protein H6807_13380 [Planctomycetes bacterium]|nr:hypothetical protein [Planctomycetota bacterium]
MIRSSTIFLIVLVSVALCGFLPAQREGRRRQWDPRDQDARVAFLEQLERQLARIDSKLDAKALAEFKTIAHSVVRRLGHQELEHLGGLTLTDQVREIVGLHRHEREEEARRFIAWQPPAIRAELERLDPDQRDARIFALKAAAALERAISMAAGHELIDDDETERLRALEPRDQLDEAYRLQRVIFMHVHGSELDQAEKTRLEQVDGRDFWRDETVRRFQLRGRLSRDDISRLMKVAEGERKALLEALGGEASLDDFVARGVLDQETARRWSSLDQRERGRLARVLDRLHFSRREHVFVPFDLAWRLPEEKRRQFMTLPREEQGAYLEANLEEKDRLVYRQRVDAMARLEPLLARLDPGQKGMLFGIMPEVAREHLLSFLPEEAERVDAVVADLVSAGFFLFTVPLHRELRAKLSPEELAALADMSLEQRADFLFGRFPEDYDADARGRLKRAGQELPADWARRSGARKVAHLNRLGQRLQGGGFGWRGRPPRDRREGATDEPEKSGDRRHRFGRRPREDAPGAEERERKF